ncbi:hypothetical protein D3C80_1504180 [compost metagenome]
MVLWEMLQEVAGQPPRGFEETLLPRIAVSQREAVDAPGLAPRPGRSVLEALRGSAADGISVLLVKVKGVVGGVVPPHQEPAAFVGMNSGALGIAAVSGLFSCPVEQREVHQAVDDNPPAVVGVTFRPPRLEHLRC